METNEIIFESFIDAQWSNVMSGYRQKKKIYCDFCKRIDVRILIK